MGGPGSGRKRGSGKGAKWQKKNRSKFEASKPLPKHPGRIKTRAAKKLNFGQIMRLHSYKKSIRHVK